MKKIFSIFLFFFSLCHLQGQSFDLEFTESCMTDSISHGNVVEFIRVYDINTGSTIDIKNDLTGEYTPLGVVRSCRPFDVVDYTEQLNEVIEQLTPDTSSTEITKKWHSDAGLADGSVITFENCEFLSFAWGYTDTTGIESSGHITLFNEDSGSEMKYLQISGVAPVITSTNGLNDTYTIDATNSVGMYYVSRGCGTEPYECIEVDKCKKDCCCLGWGGNGILFNFNNQNIY